MEGIERDRAILRKMKRFDKDSLEAAYLESLKQKRISYIPNLLAASKSVAPSSKGISGSIRLKMRGMSTRNILFAVDESFRNVDKKTIRRLERIKDELVRREDLFASILEHMETVEIMEDDFFSWYPGFKTCDIFGFFLELVPNLLDVYKEYFITTLILQRLPKRKILDVFRSRLSRNMQCFDVIERDLDLFDEVSRNALDGGRIITPSYWSSGEDRCEEVMKFFPHIKERACLTPDIYVELFHPLSYAEISINNKEMVVSFVQLNDLLTKNDRSLEFWMQAGVVDKDWRYT